MFDRRRLLQSAALGAGLVAVGGPAFARQAGASQGDAAAQLKTFMDATFAMACQPVEIAGLNRMRRKMMDYAIRNDPAWMAVARPAALVQFGLMQFISSFLLLMFALFLLLSMSWELTLITLIVFPFIIGASVKFQRDANKAYLEVREKVGANLSALQEGITGVRVIQAYAREDEQIRRFEESNRSLFRSHMHSVRVSTWYFGLIEFSGIASTALIVGIGGWLVHNGSVSLGTVVAFVLLLAQLFDPVQQLSQLYNTLQSAAAALHKLFGILDTVPDVDEDPHPVQLAAVGDLQWIDRSSAAQLASCPVRDLAAVD